MESNPVGRQPQQLAEGALFWLNMNSPSDPPHFLPQAPQPLDPCSVGVVLRAVLLVQSVLAVAAMFGAAQMLDWLQRFSWLTLAGLPATLAWLIATCLLRKYGSLRFKPAVQSLVSIALGALAGLYGCFVLAWIGLPSAPPWWASAATGAWLAGVLINTLRWRAKASLPAATAARLAELQARIRPHFLFNTLNSAIALVRAQPVQAEQVLEDLSELFRHALADASGSVPLSQEIALAQRYLAIEQIRFGPRLQVQWQLDPAANQAQLPPLLLQPLVENAIHHGVEPSVSGAQVSITTQRRSDKVIVLVANTVPAGSGDPRHGLALSNVRERLTLLHDVQAQFQSGIKDGVFQVRLEIPV